MNLDIIKAQTLNQINEGTCRWSCSMGMLHIYKVAWKRLHSGTNSALVLESIDDQALESWPSGCMYHE
ncbi:hypothetical protein AG4045_013031 [Apium graveolens]|uniref:Uncharacterized protein n=1 Tax=Apium graveolens TaxID=4045 RepID=A0A6L5BAE9_APIGR|nr:hypothetical protein AG4045_013031 [Apium graveolens]